MLHLSEATVRQLQLIIHREHEGFTKTRHTELQGASRLLPVGTEGIRALGDSWEAISLASSFWQLTGDWESVTQPQCISIHRDFQKGKQHYWDKVITLVHRHEMWSLWNMFLIGRAVRTTLIIISQRTACIAIMVCHFKLLNHSFKLKYGADKCKLAAPLWPLCT